MTNHLKSSTKQHEEGHVLTLPLMVALLTLLDGFAEGWNNAKQRAVRNK